MFVIFNSDSRQKTACFEMKRLRHCGPCRRSRSPRSKLHLAPGWPSFIASHISERRLAEPSTSPSGLSAWSGKGIARRLTICANRMRTTSPGVVPICSATFAALRIKTRSTRQRNIVVCALMPQLCDTHARCQPRDWSFCPPDCFRFATQFGGHLLPPPCPVGIPEKKRPTVTEVGASTFWRRDGVPKNRRKLTSPFRHAPPAIWRGLVLDCRWRRPVTRTLSRRCRWNGLYPVIG